jgi:hypothetical protein
VILYPRYLLLIGSLAPEIDDVGTGVEPSRLKKMDMPVNKARNDPLAFTMDDFGALAGYRPALVFRVGWFS